MARVRGKKSPNADLIEAVQNYTEEILLFSESVEDDRPFIFRGLSARGASNFINARAD